MKHTIIIGKRYREDLSKALQSNGFDVKLLPDNPKLDPRLAGHCDLSLIKTSENSFVIARSIAEVEEGKSIVNFLTNRGERVEISTREQASAYPQDVSLCACVIGDRLIHNTKYTDDAVLNMFSADKLIHVNQGYAKCTVCAVTDNSAITDDAGIAKALLQYGIDTLLLEPGLIELDGFEYGFIGGAGFVCDNTLYLTGIVKKAAETLIKSFLSKYNIKLHCLTQKRAFDVGGFILA